MNLNQLNILCNEANAGKVADELLDSKVKFTMISTQKTLLKGLLSLS